MKLKKFPRACSLQSFKFGPLPTPSLPHSLSLFLPLSLPPSSLSLPLPHSPPLNFSLSSPSNKTNLSWMTCHQPYEEQELSHLCIFTRREVYIRKIPPVYYTFAHTSVHQDNKPVFLDDLPPGPGGIGASTPTIYVHVCVCKICRNDYNHTSKYVHISTTFINVYYIYVHVSLHIHVHACKLDKAQKKSISPPSIFLMHVHTH